MSSAEIAPTAETVDTEEDVDETTNLPSSTRPSFVKSKVRPSGSCALPLE